MRMLLKPWNELPDFMKNDEVKLYYDNISKKRFSLISKRIFDIIMSSVLIILVSPILLVLSIWIKIDSNGPVFYRQERVTQYGKTFQIYKFRSMIVNADQTGASVTIKNDSRITKVGNRIRKSRLDELPQLFNVLIGDMSFVGARPEVRKYVNEYTEEMNATLLLPAGITSLASIKFKNEDDIINSFLKKGQTIDEIYLKGVLPKKMSYNLDYLYNFGLLHDFWLCLQTVFFRRCS